VSAAADTQVDAETAAHLTRTVHGPIVAWFAPFTSAVDGLRFVQAFHVLMTWRRPDAYVVMAGPVVDAAHLDALQRFVTELNIDRSWLAGDPSPGRLETFRRAAALILTPAVLEAADAAAGRRLGAGELGLALGDLLPAPVREL
jgi:hypothetical protein